MQIVDANIILRYLLEDHASLSVRAKDIIDGNVVKIPVEVLCEVVYVLTSFYKTDRRVISDQLKVFFAETRCELPHRSAVLRGLSIFAEKNLDFVDCILIGYRECESAEIHTFDGDVQKMLDKIV